MCEQMLLEEGCFPQSLFLVFKSTVMKSKLIIQFINESINQSGVISSKQNIINIDQYIHHN